MNFKNLVLAFTCTVVMSPAMAQVKVENEEYSRTDETGRTYTYSVLMECRSNICAGLIRFIDSKPDKIPAEVFCKSQVMQDAITDVMAEAEVGDYERRFACGAA